MIFFTGLVSIWCKTFTNTSETLNHSQLCKLFYFRTQHFPPGIHLFMLHFRLRLTSQKCVFSIFLQQSCWTRNWTITSTDTWHSLCRATSSPEPSPRSKWRIRETLHESWSILSRNTWGNRFLGGCFPCLAALFVFCNRKPLFKQIENISSCLRVKILTNFWSHFGSLAQGFLRSTILNEEQALGTRFHVVL